MYFKKTLFYDKIKQKFQEEILNEKTVEYLFGNINNHVL